MNTPGFLACAGRFIGVAALLLMAGCDDPKAGTGQIPVPGGTGAPSGQTTVGAAGMPGVAGTAGIAGAAAAAATHAYAIKVEGTPGVKLRMLLVAKQPYGAPLREERPDNNPVVVPFELPNLRAAGCYAWFDELHDETSGKTGDHYRVTITRDGVPLPGGCDGQINPGVPSACGVGDL